MRKLSLLLVLVLLLTSLVPAPVVAARRSSYEQTLFDRSQPIVINIMIEQETWDNMIATAEDEVYCACDVEVNGTLYRNVAIRPKGNSSLSSVAGKGSERFSWRIKFDKYEKKQTCDGLDILILNNGFKDPGQLREAIAYDMYAFLDADASLYNYAIVSVNGEYFGCYLALECVDESFAERVYGEDYGELYKPEIIGLNDNNEGEEAADNDATDRPAAGNEDDGSSFGGSSGGRTQDTTTLAMALNYVGDDLDDYYGIWESSKFKSDEEDHAQVVEALKHICQGEDIDEYLDVENVLKYLAIQTFIYNHDGLTGNVTHNYYLYEKGGELNLIPWDMNEAFTISGDGSDYVNFPIDTPFTVSDLSERSFFMALLANEKYLACYHEYLRILCEEYVQGGAFDQTMASIRAMIDEAVMQDPTKFCTYEEYEAAANSLIQAVSLRARSVLGQIDGSIPSTREGQAAEPEKLLDTSDADFSGLGGGTGGGMPTMNFPGFGFGF